MSDYEMVIFSPELQAAMQKIYDNSMRHAIDSYLDMLKSMSNLPEEQLVNGALNLAREEASGEKVGGGFGNHWLQALSIKNPVSALLVSEMIDSGNIPEPNSNE